MRQQIYVNLPVEDLAKSMEFFSKLGFTYQKEFTNEQAAAMIVSKDIFVMLVTRPFFASFSKKSIADAKKVMEVQLAFNADSKAAVDEMVEKAMEAGSPRVKPGKDDEFMYSRGFEDPDHHMWDYFWMDSASVPDELKS